MLDFRVFYAPSKNDHQAWYLHFAQGSALNLSLGYWCWKTFLWSSRGSPKLSEGAWRVAFSQGSFCWGNFDYPRNYPLALTYSESYSQRILLIQTSKAADRNFQLSTTDLGLACKAAQADFAIKLVALAWYLQVFNSMIRFSNCRDRETFSFVWAWRQQADHK